VHPIDPTLPERIIVCMIDHDALILGGTTGTSFDRFPSHARDHASFSPDSLIPSSYPASGQIDQTRAGFGSPLLPSLAGPVEQTDAPADRPPSAEQHEHVAQAQQQL
jgi:hypothetical protein